MPSIILDIEIFKRLRKCPLNNTKIIKLTARSYGLVFFGTPHGGPGDDWKITFAKASVCIAQSLPGITSNDIMEALKKGSLFSDSLQNQWRHQLDRYRIVTFYEGIGSVSVSILIDQYNYMLTILGCTSNICRNRASRIP